MTDTPHPILQAPHDSYESEILKRVWDRMHKDDRHAMISFVGEEGAGKSQTSLLIGKLIDPDFTADSVIFQASTLIERLKNDEFYQGQVFVLDEAGVSLGKRSWYDKDQIEINKSFQLIRSHNITVLFTLPRLSELDSQTESRLQAFFEIDKRIPGSHVEGRWKYIDPDRSGSSGENYKKYPRVWRNGQKIRVTSLRFDKWESPIIDEYEQRKAAHQKRVYEQALGGTDGDGGTADDGPNLHEIADTVTENMDNYVSTHNGNGMEYVSKELIEVEHGLSLRQAKKVKTIAEKAL